MAENLNQEQAAPADGTGPDCWELVLADMRERRELGIEKYGKPLRPDNGRDALVDAYQEVLDLTVYLRQAIEQSREMQARLKAEQAAHQQDVVFFENEIRHKMAAHGKSLDDLLQTRARMADLYEAVMAFLEWFIGLQLGLEPPGMNLFMKLSETAKAVAQKEGFKTNV